MADLGTLFATKTDTAESSRWYSSQLAKLGTQNPTGIVGQSKSLFANQLLPGRMYLYAYDPKLKDTLAMYDTFPLVIPFNVVSDGFYGINLHYLQYPLRERILGKLMEWAAGSNEDRYLQFSYQMLNSAARLKPVKECVKHYLNAHIRSRFLQIPINDWNTAAMLPLQRFIYKA